MPAPPFTEYFAYNNPGQQTLHVSFEGVVMQPVYDSQIGRLSEARCFENVDAYANSTGTPSETWTYKHDAFGPKVDVAQTIGRENKVSGTSCSISYSRQERLPVQVRFLV